MFGAGVPVCAVQFAALPELVVDGSNGAIFKDSDELGDVLYDLLVANNSKLIRMKEYVSSNFSMSCWEDNWLAVMQPIVIECLELHKKRVKKSLTFMKCLICIILVITSMLVRHSVFKK